MFDLPFLFYLTDLKKNSYIYLKVKKEGKNKMANLKTLNANSVDFSFKDSEARKSIEVLKTEKAEAFSVNPPLKYENNTLSINLSNYTTTNSFNETTEELNNTINNNNSNLSKKISDIQKVLTTVFGDGITIGNNNNIIINQNKIPSLSDYKNTIENINSSIRVVNTRINDVNSTLQEDINDKYNEITKKIEAITTDNTENIENLQNRVSAIEDKWFKQGSTVPKIDELEAKVNEIYNKLEAMEWI